MGRAGGENASQPQLRARGEEEEENATTTAIVAATVTTNGAPRRGIIVGLDIIIARALRWGRRNTMMDDGYVLYGRYGT